MKKLLFVLALLLAVSLPLASCGGKEAPEGTPNDLGDVSLSRAVEGRDYVIDEVRVAVADYKAENGQVTYMSYPELREEVARRRELGEEIHFRVTVKYTALRELAGAGVDMYLSFWSFEGGSAGTTYGDRVGNGTEDDYLRSLYLFPGVHYLSFDVDIYARDTQGDEQLMVIENLDALDTDLTYRFYIYD